MNPTTISVAYTPQTIAKDFLSGVIVFLVALPLCLGIAIGSGADPMSGLIAGIVGGIVIGMFSGSHTSVSGPAAGLTAIVASQIAILGAFDTFLLAVMLAGVLQVFLGVFKAGALSAFFPSSVIKGLLAAIGIILILGQFPLLLGLQKDLRGSGPAATPLVEGSDPSSTSLAVPTVSGEDATVNSSSAGESDVAVHVTDQDSHGNAAHGHEIGEQIWKFLRDLKATFQYDDGIQWASLLIGIISLAFLIVWDQIKVLKKSLVPSPLLVVLLGAVLSLVFSRLNWGGGWEMAPNHFVFVPTASSWEEVAGFISLPDFRQLSNSAVYVAAVTIAIVASLETLLNLDAVDKLDKKQRISPPNRELFAQGIGNICCGLIGGLPVTSVVIRGSVNVNAGSETKLSAIIHGVLLLGCVLSIPWVLNLIPLSCLAAILLMTGYKLANPALFQSMAQKGRYQFLPFILTLVAIVLTDLLIGILFGLAIALVFVLHSNLRRPIRRIHEKHIDGEIFHIELANQVSFLNRAALESALRETPRGGRVLIDARRTDYIDPDVLSLICEFKDVTAPVYDIQVGLAGFRDKYNLVDTVETIDFGPRENRDNLTALQVVGILAEGNTRYAEGHPLDRALRRNLDDVGNDPCPIAAILTGIDSQSPAEMIFDLGLGDAYVLRVPGNVVGPRTIGGFEFATAIGGVKVIVVMGHADSSLLSLAIKNAALGDRQLKLDGCDNLDYILNELSQSVDATAAQGFQNLSPSEQEAFLNAVIRRHVARSVNQVPEQAPTLKRLIERGQLAVVGAVYDPKTGKVEFDMQGAIGIS